MLNNNVVLYTTKNYSSNFR